MTVAYDMSQSALIADLEAQILRYLRGTEAKRAAADEVVGEIRKQHQFLSTAPIVTAIWDLNAKSKIQIDGDWNITLRDTTDGDSVEVRP